MKSYKLFFVALLALLLSACVRKPYFPKQKDVNDYCRIVPWQYQGHDFAVELRFPVKTVEHYDSLPKDRQYIDCIREDAEYPYALRVAQMLDSVAEPYGFTEKEMDQFGLSFVQSLGYHLDPGGYGYNRPPIVTLYEGGDCVDLVLVYDLLCATRGQRTGMLIFPKHHHMAGGIQLDGYSYNSYRSATGHWYAFCEATSKDWEIGEDWCRGEDPRIIEVPPIISRWSRTHRHPAVRCELPVVTVSAQRHRKTRLRGK